MAKANRMKTITDHAKKIRKPNEKWTAAIKRASAELKKLNKI